MLVGETSGLRPAIAGEPVTTTSQSRSGAQAAPSGAYSGAAFCTHDGLIHAEVSGKITALVKDWVLFSEPGAQFPDIAKLDLPCGFHLDPREVWSLTLTDGTSFRRYRDFGQQTDQTSMLGEEVIDPASRPTGSADTCSETIKTSKPQLQQCTSGASAFFAVDPSGGKIRLVHYIVSASQVKEDFVVAEVAVKVDGLSFLPSPDTSWFGVTLILEDRGAVYRAFLDVPRS